MASQAVNYRSFMNALGNRIGVDSQYLHKFILASSNEYGRALRVREAVNICVTFMQKMQLGSELSDKLGGIVIPAEYGILSVNTAKQILDKYISCFNWTVAFDTPNLGDINSGIKYRTIIKDPVATSTTFDVTVVGGGAGGSGGATLDGNKDTNFSVTINQGYAGTGSYLQINQQDSVYAAGGTQQAQEKYNSVGANPVGYKDGKTGYNGETVTATITLNDGYFIEGVKGAGGDGSGGIAINSSSSSSYANSRNGVNANSWTGDQTTTAGGGGSGGNSTSSPGTSDMRGPKWTNVVATAGEQITAIGVASKGGTGGYNSNSSTGVTQPAQADGAGLGGTGGKHKRATDSNCTSNGGNGGNSGAINGTSSVNIIYLLVS